MIRSRISSGGDSTSSQTMSRRGVINCGIFRSARRKILSTSSCSAASNTPASAPTSISILTSSSVIGGSSVGLAPNSRSRKDDEALRQMSRDGRAAERPGQNADECDADLNRRKKAVRRVGQFERDPRPVIFFSTQLQPRLARRDKRDLRHCKEAVRYQ